MNLAKLFYYIFSLSLMGSILAIGIIIVKSLFRHKLSANFHYYIWFLLFLRLIIPFTSSVAFDTFNFFPKYEPVIEINQPLEQSTASINSQSSNIANKDILSTKSSSSDLISKDNTPQNSMSKNLFSFNTLSIIWMIGVVAVFLFIILVNGMFLFKSKKLVVCQDRDILKILEECEAILKSNSEVELLYDNTIKSPSIFGILHPKISISQQLIGKLTPEELHYILLHELSHLKRKDIYVNALILTLQTIYWFNPIILYALHQMKQDCEIACDAKTLEVLKPNDYKQYGKTVIKLLQLLSEPKLATGTLRFVNKFNKRRIVMISSFKKTTIKWAAVAITLTLLAGCSSLNSPVKTATSEPNQSNTAIINKPGSDTNNNSSNSTSTSTSQGAGTVSYTDNNTYGFSVTLPQDWKGFTVVNSIWEGFAVNGDTSKVYATGPMISIRNPKWTAKAPMQDIPIMIFTIEQWNYLQKGEFHIGAAPINPSELGRNNKYVFALPARYNYAFLTGYKEVETILNGKPLKTTNIDNKAPDSITSLLSNIMLLGKQGKVINSDFLAKINTIGDVQKKWGKADKTDWVAAAKGSYATYNKYNIVFGFNKGDQIFEIRDTDILLKSITISKVKAVLGTPAYDSKSNGEEIIGYVASPEFKVEMVFSEPTKANSDPVMDHYNVLYPAGTVNSMSNDPGRQW